MRHFATCRLLSSRRRDDARDLPFATVRAMSALIRTPRTEPFSAVSRPCVRGCSRKSRCSARNGGKGKSISRHVRCAAVDNDANTNVGQEAQPPPPPYSALSVPVYSLATVPGADSGLRPSMNITTYACPVTIKPTRRMAVALYTHTVTARNMMATGRGVLQILRERHVDLVPLLGKSSADDVDKLAELAQLGIEVEERCGGIPTIADCAGYVELSVVSVQNAGDHDLALCDVVSYADVEGEGAPLYTGAIPKA